MFVIGGYIYLIRTVEKKIKESKKNETAEIPEKKDSDVFEDDFMTSWLAMQNPAHPLYNSYLNIFRDDENEI